MKKSQRMVSKSRDRSDPRLFNNFQEDIHLVPDTGIHKLHARNKKVVYSPKTITQEDYITVLKSDRYSVVFAVGPAGTGKTFLSVLAAIEALKEERVSKIIITRPAVCADDEKHGFLPGTLNEKLLPWVAPVMDIFKEYYSPTQLKTMVEYEIIELAPLAFLRGRTFKNAYIIGDEMQNSTVNSMKMFLTRIGENSKIVVTGDLMQHDRKFTTDNGLKDFITRVGSGGSHDIAVVNFTGYDIQRHPVVKEVLELYGEI